MSMTIIPKSLLAGLFVCCCSGTSAVAGLADWTTWGSEAYVLDAWESIQLTIDAEQIPLRRWKLVVDGDQLLCDLHVLRMRDRSRIYALTDESHHEVELPWGLGEEISISLAAKRHGGVFTLTMLGPVDGQAEAVYSYAVNRALELRASGDDSAAKSQIYKALRDDPDDSVARIILAGMLSAEGNQESALDELDMALATGLPQNLRPVDRLEMTINLGRTLHRLGRHYQALEMYQDALSHVVNALNEAELKLLITDLLLDMGNKVQAAEVLASTRVANLPVDLKARAARLRKRMDENR